MFYLYSEPNVLLRPGVLHVVCQLLYGAVSRVRIHKELVDVILQGPQDKADQHVFQDGIQIQKFCRLELQPEVMEDISIKVRATNGETATGYFF